MRRFLLIAVGLCGLLRADTKPDSKEEPVGLVLNPGGGKLLRADTETPLALRAGDLLFSGDAVRTDAAPASYLYCPAKTIQTLSASGEVRLDTKAPKVKTGKISEAPARACALPPTVRVAVASQQHFGTTMTRGTPGEVKPIPREQLSADMRAQLAPLDAALAADPKDQGALVNEATIFESANLAANAVDVYYKLRAIWPDAEWIKGKIFDLEQMAITQAAASATQATGGTTYALLIGVSKYKHAELNLQFANKDAIDFSRFLQSPRGGGLSPANVLVLTDEKATTAAVRNGFQDFLKRRATKADTVVILVAGHGTVESPGSKSAFILTYDADPQDLNSTALPMPELQKLFSDQLQNVGRVLLFVDVCKAGVIGTIHNTQVAGNVEQIGDIPGELLGLLAARTNQLSLEGPQFGGGHGVFSYYVLQGLEGEADEDKDGSVEADELIKYVEDQVRAATKRAQYPKDFGNANLMVKLSDTKKPGIDLTMHWPVIKNARTGEALELASAQDTPLTPETQSAVDRYTQALGAGRLLPDQPGNAFDALQPLQSRLTAERYRELQDQLRIALENRGQETLLRYLEGDENPQMRSDFDIAGRYMAAARTLTQESLYLESREDFFEGRTALFDKKYPQAVDSLEKAVRLDPTRAYGYNALGIAYLEQAEFDRAIPAFRDAARRAQHWSYPLHNLALAYVESGDYRSAIRAYQDAMKLTPQYGYLPYNLGLVYQRTNRRKEAEASYRKAMALSPNSAEPYNALGTLKASEGKRTEAEQFYRQALQKNSELLPARHNLGLLLASDKGREKEAIDLFRANLAQSPDYIASRLSLAETLSATGDDAGAIEQYRRVIADKPNYLAARLALSKLLAKGGNADAAIDALHAPNGMESPDVYEQIGDLESSRGRGAEARAAYEQAQKLTTDSAARKRLERKRQAVK